MNRRDNLDLRSVWSAQTHRDWYSVKVKSLHQLLCVVLTKTTTHIHWKTYHSPHLLISPQSNHALHSITAKYLESLMQSTQSGKKISWVDYTQDSKSFFPQTIQEKHPLKDFWPRVRREASTWCLNLQNMNKSQAGSVWVSLGGVARLSSRILCPAPLHVIHKPNLENQHFTLSLFLKYKKKKKALLWQKVEWRRPLVDGEWRSWSEK